MPIESFTHQFEEITYLSDDLQVKALMMTPHHEVNRIVVYLRGGKGQVGRVRAGRLMQFSDSQTLVIGPYYRGNNGSEGKDEFYRGDLNDVTQLLRLLHDKYPHAFIHMVGFFARWFTRIVDISRLTSNKLYNLGWCLRY